METTDSSPSIVIYAHTPVYHPSLGVTSERDKDECPAYAGATMHSHAELNDDETTSNWLIKNRQLQTHCNDRTAAQVLSQNPTSVSEKFGLAVGLMKVEGRTNKMHHGRDFLQPQHFSIKKNLDPSPCTLFDESSFPFLVSREDIDLFFLLHLNLDPVSCNSSLAITVPPSLLPNIHPLRPHRRRHARQRRSGNRFDPRDLLRLFMYRVVRWVMKNLDSTTVGAQEPIRNEVCIIDGVGEFMDVADHLNNLAKTLERLSKTSSINVRHANNARQYESERIARVRIKAELFSAHEYAREAPAAGNTPAAVDYPCLGAPGVYNEDNYLNENVATTRSDTPTDAKTRKLGQGFISMTGLLHLDNPCLDESEGLLLVLKVWHVKLKLFVCFPYASSTPSSISFNLVDTIVASRHRLDMDKFKSPRPRLEQYAVRFHVEIWKLEAGSNVMPVFKTTATIYRRRGSAGLDNACAIHSLLPPFTTVSIGFPLDRDSIEDPIKTVKTDPRDIYNFRELAVQTSFARQHVNTPEQGLPRTMDIQILTIVPLYECLWGPL